MGSDFVHVASVRFVFGAGGGVALAHPVVVALLIADFVHAACFAWLLPVYGFLLIFSGRPWYLRFSEPFPPLGARPPNLGHTIRIRITS